jgi:glycerol-3-phosphate dehydrogenase
MAARMSRAYGARLDRVLRGAESLTDLGRDFGAGLYEAELRYLVEHEFARTADDVLWRRTKLGLEMTAEQRDELAAFMRS